MAFFHELLERAACFRSGFADDAKGALGGRFGNEPDEVRSVLGNEPDARGIRRHIFGERDDGLHERHGFERRPSRGASDATDGAIAADNRAGRYFFAGAVGAAFDFEDQAAPVGMQGVEAAA